VSNLTRFLDWLDEAAAGLIRIAYLLAGITAVAVYFGAGHLPAAIEDTLNGILPWALAFAVETHCYISARRVRVAWQDGQASTPGSIERERATRAMRVNLAILTGLLAFSAWNQLNYLYDTWTPPTTALALPGWLAYVVRALVVPGAFMAAAFLAPLAEPITAQLEAEARATLADVFKIARKQRRKMLRAAEKDGRDMTGALVELVPDPETRRIISHAYAAIQAPTQAPIQAPIQAQAQAPTAHMFAQPALPAPEPPPNPQQRDPQTEPAYPPFEGPNTPEIAQGVQTHPAQASTAAEVMRANRGLLRLPTARTSPVRTPARTATRATTKATTKASVGRTKADAETLRTERERIARDLLLDNPQMSVRDLTRQLAIATRRRISESTASNLKAIVLRDLLAAQPEQHSGIEQEEAAAEA
jgi:hypothetical protein